jgi:hypothetical protein
VDRRPLLSQVLGGAGVLQLRNRRLQPQGGGLAARAAHAHDARAGRAADGARTRAPGADVALVHHADRGSQYTSIDYTQTLADHRVLASVGSVGDAYDNALAESFVDSFKTELIADRVWRTRSQLELAAVEYIGWFNDARLHQALGDLPPSEFERLSQSSTLEITPLMTRGNQSIRSPRNPVRLNALVVHLRYPTRHRRRWRSTNLLERSLGEVKRRTKVIGRFPGETSCLTLVWAVLDLYITYGTNGIKFTELERQRLRRIRRMGSEPTSCEEVTAA